MKMNMAKTKVMVVDNNPINVNNVRGKVLKALYTWGNTTASGKITRTGRICLKRQVRGSTGYMGCRALWEIVVSAE